MKSYLRFGNIPKDKISKVHRSDVIPTAEPQREWIPISERLPYNHEYIQNNGLFIVSDGNRSYAEWFDIYDKQMFGEPTMSGFRVDYAVTAWMTLPQPYKAESEDRNESAISY